LQNPESAKFDGMPRSAIDAGLADIVAPAEELAGKIAAYLQHVPVLATRPETRLADASRSGLEKVILLLRAQTRHDFRSTRRTPFTAGSAAHQLTANYGSRTMSLPAWKSSRNRSAVQGVAHRCHELSYNQHIEAVENRSHTGAAGSRPKGGRCGPQPLLDQESLFARDGLQRGVEQTKPAVRYSLQIFATDLDEDAIETARIGLYPANIAADIQNLD
jgi:two-component system CheB/CheR fusion protein